MKTAIAPQRTKKPLRTKRRWLKTTIIVVMSIAILLSFAPALVLHIFINRHCTYKGVETEEYPMQGIYKASDFGLTEDVHILETSDGEKLWVSEIAPEHPKAVVIYLSGIMQPSVTYFYGHAKMMQKENIASFLLEVRSHGQSTGNQLGLGHTEVTDVQTVINYIHTKKEYEDVPIILQGVSMGGAIVLNAFGEIPDVDGCIAMSPYASFEDELNLVMQQYRIPEFLRSYELFFLRQVLYLNFSKEAVDSLKPKLAIQKANGRPVAIIACKEDTSVMAENAEILKENADFADVWIRDSWEHFIVKDYDFKNVEEDTEYCAYIKDFINKTIDS